MEKYNTLGGKKTRRKVEGFHAKGGRKSYAISGAEIVQKWLKSPLFLIISGTNQTILKNRKVETFHRETVLRWKKNIHKGGRISRKRWKKVIHNGGRTSFKRWKLFIRNIAKKYHP